MSFIDNSGDIILDAVLTDLGRELLARGDGSFKISHFGLDDDEINYALYDATAATNAEATTIKQLPVFEAMTENSIALKSRLINIVRNDLLYLPIMKLNELALANKKSTSGYFAIAVDQDTEDMLFSGSGGIQGVLGGARPEEQPAFVRADQGLDTTEISFKEALSPDLFETSYRIKLDNRFGRPVSTENALLDIATIDNSNIASYDISLSSFVGSTTGAVVTSINNTTDSKFMTIAGPRGSKLEFKIRSADALQYSTAFFTKLGGTMNASTFGASGTLLYIDTILKIEGSVTGYALDLPVRFIKKQ